MQPKIPFPEVYIEVASICNARCPWCDTGMRKDGTLQKLPNVSKHFMEPQEFLKIVLHMKSIGIIDQNTIVGPFNFGEPLLHPKIETVLQALEGLRQPYMISTNASVIPRFTGKVRFHHLRKLVFSMPGYSEDSYEKIHGFSFSRIQNNIKKIVQNFRKLGFRGEARIAYHEYKFNHNEKKEACRFAFHNGMKLQVNTAVPVSVEVSIKYLSGNIDSRLKEKMEEQIDTDILKKNLITRPQDYICHPKRVLTISSTGQLLRCCAISEQYPGLALGSIFDMNKEMLIEHLVQEHPLCRECMDCGADYFMTSCPCRTIEEPSSIADMPERKAFLTPDGTWLWLQDKGCIVSTLVKEDKFEPHISGFFQNYVREGDVCFDIGANIGYYTTLLGRKIGDKGRVYAFEPSPHFRHILEHTVKHNGLEDRVTVFPYGLSDSYKNVELLQNNSTGGQCFPSSNEPIRRDMVTVCPLDTLVGALNLSSLDIIKIDVDGHEPYVLKGALETINRFNPLIIMEVSHLHYYLEETTAWDFYHWLKEQSFHIYRESGEKILSLIDFLVHCANFNKVCNIIVTRVPLEERKKLHSLGLNVPIVRQSKCPICNSEWYSTGPGGRKGHNERMPRCLSCNSLERHRANRIVLERLTPVIRQGSALQFSHDTSVPEGMFSSFECSIYRGENSLDLQAIDRKSSSYEYVICNHVLEHVADDVIAFKELLRILTPTGVLQISFPDPMHRLETEEYGEAIPACHNHYRVYGQDVWNKFARYAVFYVLRVDTKDPVTEYEDCIFFVSKNKERLLEIREILGGSIYDGLEQKQEDLHTPEGAFGGAMLYPLPPMQLRFMNEDDHTYLRIGDQQSTLLEQILDFDSTPYILDIGCGYGRLAHALIRSRRFTGCYYGLDILPQHIAWCKETLSPYGKYFFTYAPIKNNRYNPLGVHCIEDLDFSSVLPQVDIVCFFSVFTHLYEDEIRSYLKVVSSLLDSGKAVICTAFLLNESSKAGEDAGHSMYPMKYSINSYTKYYDSQDPLHAIGYEEIVFKELLYNEGFTDIQIQYGSWCGRRVDKDKDGFQDVIIAKKT